MEHIRQQAHQAMEELIALAGLKPGQLVVIGCSSSEMVGQRIGKGSSMDAARAAWEGIAPLIKQHGLRLAVQCCEHLNRALIVERETADALNLDIVTVMPSPDAGGSFATIAYGAMADPVAVEYLQADAGLDIGGTLMGMHLKQVAVPVRLSIGHIGEAAILCARTRPKYIGGPRAQYPGA